MVYNTARFGSPFATGYEFWVPEDYFGWQFALTAPAGGGTEGNLSYYLRVLAGGGDLYPWPIALLTLAGTVGAFRRPGAQRLLAGLSSGFVALLVAFHTAFFWQSERFLLPALPLLCSLAALPFGSRSRPAVRIGAILLAILAFSGFLKSEQLYRPPTKNFQQVATLHRIGELVESNAAVLVRTNVFFFERILRRGTDRVWVPLEFCEHRARIRSLALRPYAESGDNGSWTRDIVHSPFDARSAEAGIRALLREGRPVYFSTLLAFQVPFWADLTRFLTSRFVIEAVSQIGRWQLLRIRDRKPSSTLPPGISADHTS